MQTSRRVFLNAVSRWIATFVQGVFGAFLVRFLLDKLGQDAYGLTALMGAVVAMATVADLGLGGALGRHLAAQLALRNEARFNQLASSAFLCYVAVGATLSIACLICAPQIARFINAPATLMAETLFLLRGYAAPALLLSFITPVYVGVISGTNRFDLLNWISVGMGIVRAVILFLILGLTSAGLRGWAAGMLFTQVLQLALTAGAAYWVCPWGRITPWLANRTAFSTLFSTGIYLFALQLTNLLSVKADPIILTTFLGPGAVALYSPAVTLAGAVRPLVTTLADQLHPLATTYHETGNKRNLGEVLIRGTKLTLLLGVGACVMLGAFAEPIARLWLAGSLGSGYVVTAQVLVLWAAVDLLGYAAGSQWAVLLGTGRLRFLTWTQLPFAVLNVAASAALVGFTKLGVVGVVIPTLVIALIRRPIIVAHAARVCEIPIGLYLREGYLRPAVVLAVLTVAALNVRFLAKPSSLLSLLSWAVVLGVLFTLLCWSVGLNKLEKEMLRSLLIRRSKR